MADDSEFLSRLISFGLSEKEAQVYLHPLKYGPKPTSLLAKSLKTYREDVHRTLNALIDKDMVNPSLDSRRSIRQWSLKLLSTWHLKSTRMNSGIWK
jgi:sugar-specific transcriptional regulator TrmB